MSFLEICKECLIREHKKTIYNMHKLGWKAQLFKSADVSMLFHGCGVSQYRHFYDRIKNIYQMSPRPYVGSHNSYIMVQDFMTNI